jgi:hypothetical protein
MVVTSALGVAFIFLVLGLITRHFLLPGILILGSFILFVLWLAGLIAALWRGRKRERQLPKLRGR